MDDILQVKNITYKYPHGDQACLHNISFEMNQGEWLCILGSNGSGKSTLAKIINNLLSIQEGEICFDGKYMSTDIDTMKQRSKIGMVFQNPDNQFVGVTVKDDVAFGLENNQVIREEMELRIADSLKAVDMEKFADYEPHNLSGGQKQRVALAGALALHPKLLILDEATAMLDPYGKQEILKILNNLKKEKNLTILSITHDVEEAKQADKILVINRGTTIYYGKPNEFFIKKEAVIQAGLELPFINKVEASLNKYGLNLVHPHEDIESLVNELWELNLKT